MDKEGGALELCLVNPVAVFGPVLGPDYSTSILLLKRLLDGSVPGCPRLYFGVVDVRDVAALHLRAMTHPAAKGERFLAVAGDCMSILDMAHVLRLRMGAAAKKVPSLQLPNWLVRLVALGNPVARQILPELGKVKNASSEGQAPVGMGAALQRGVHRRHRESLVRLGLSSGDPARDDAEQFAQQ
jgi:nucleoside-diphosphate-sugar epimerase